MAATTEQQTTSWQDIAKSIAKLGGNAGNLVGQDGLNVNTKVEVSFDATTIAMMIAGAIFVAMLIIFVINPLSYWFYDKMGWER